MRCFLIKELLPGAFAEYMLMSACGMFRVPDNIPWNGSNLMVMGTVMVDF
jgi:NADPH:quinone reductase-like Zn-dependent oxidoreductase